MRKSSIWPSLFPFLLWLPQMDKQTLKADLMAGLTGGVMVLPQAVAYAMIAGLPPEYGIYTAIIPAMIASLFGSSLHLISGPTAALSVIIFTTVSSFAQPGSPLYIQLAITLTLCVGVVQLLFGLLRFGALVNFVSHSVVLGFTAGAAIVIAASQIKNLLGLQLENDNTALNNLMLAWQNLEHTHWPTLLVGLVTIATCILAKRIAPKLPNMLIGMFVGSVLAIGLQQQGEIALLGAISSGLPQFSLPVVEIEQVSAMFSGIIAVALLGLVEAISIARSVAIKSRQMMDGNQEFIGQGLSNVAGGFFSCYVSSGSFTRSGVNYDSGAKTPLAAVFAAIFLALIILFVADLTAYIPIASMAGTLFIVAYNLIDRGHIEEVLKTDKQESLILIATFFTAILFQLEMAIYIGVIMSLLFYLRRVAKPDVDFIDPREVGLPEPLARETRIIRINGSIFFGSSQHLQWVIQQAKVKHLIILGRGINFIDFAGAQMLAEEVGQEGRTLYFCRLKAGPRETLEHASFAKHFETARFYPELRQIVAELNK